MSEKKSKSNKKFMLLSALGIFMVVDHHTWTALNLLGEYIPYNSFFMPMFVFISGYFNKVDSSTKLWPYTKKKVRNLLVPYLGISVVVFCLQWLMNLIKLGHIEPLPAGYFQFMLERVITVGSPMALNTPMWFVITLFLTLMVYAVLKKLLGKIWNSYIMFAIFAGLHFFAVYIAHTSDPGSLSYSLHPLKVMFMLPFLELGIIYRDKFEKKHDAMPGGGKIALLFGLLIFNMIRTIYLPNPYDVAFDSLDDLSGMTSPYFVTPLISSIVGITFWLTLVDLIGKPVQDSKFVNYVSCNTFWIMGLHISFYNIFNCILLLISQHIIELPYFDIEYFQGSEWYQWEISPNIKLAYVAIGLLGPLAVKWVFDKLVAAVSSRLPKKTA